MLYTYNSNNSGGKWWLDTDDWKALEAAGWSVDWKEKPLLKALATEASKEFPSREAAISEFEEITDESFYDQGCPCCGEPHSMYPYE